MGDFVVSPILMLIADRSGLFTTTVVVAGISIVVGVLLLLILIFYLFGKIVPIIEKATKAREEKRAAKKAAKKNGGDVKVSAPTSAPAPTVKKVAPAPAPVVEQGISGEVVAAISAAIVATEGTGVVVRSIKKKNVSGRNPWAAAATADNTRPF
jgi:Na+-transporting methylmalonyl-CoA/oxaloacetate decarboxylase gamma subunit